jgi:hypothetical protein
MHMARHVTVIARLGWSLVAVALVGCAGDDVNPAVPDAGSTAPDATTSQVDSGSDAGLCTPFDAAGLDPAAITLGEAVVVAHHCQGCHGESLSGNDIGVPSPGYGTAYPPNLTPDPATGLGCWTNAQIENAFLHGIDDQGGPLCPPMPHFGEFDDGGGIDQPSADGVVAFLRHLPAIVNEVPDSPECNGLPPDAGEDGGTVPVDGGHHHHDGGLDASTDDASTEDASSEDASSQDAGSDATVTDASTADASDAGITDATSPDAHD